MNKQKINETNEIIDIDEIEQGIKEGRLSPEMVFKLMMVHIKAYKLAVDIESKYVASHEEDSFQNIEMRQCPNCDYQPEASDPDAVYPIYRDKTKWRAGCPGWPGCGADRMGLTPEEAIQNWNTWVDERI